MNKFLHHSQGFSLIEVAIAMIIFSICLGGMLTILQHNHLSQQAVTTNTHQTTLIKALNRFYSHHGRLPCPSTPQADNGFELGRCSGSHQQIGIVPYKTLGIPASTIKDGYGHHFTYAVSETATIHDSGLDRTLTSNTLKVLDAAGRAYEDGPQGIAYILISHGPKGNGAFSLKADRHRFPTRTTFEAENAADSMFFYVDLPMKESEHNVVFIQRADLEPLPAIQRPMPQTVSEDNPYHTDDVEEE